MMYFGMTARGPFRGLPCGPSVSLGFILMLGLSWFYIAIGIDWPLFAAAFAGCQAAVIAIIARGVHRLGQRSLRDWWLGAIAGTALVATLGGVHFAIPLAAGGLAYLAYKRRARATRLGRARSDFLASVGLAMASGRLADGGCRTRPKGSPSRRRTLKPRICWPPA